MLMFGKGNIESIRMLAETFGEFSKDSGLVANCRKSNVYMAGVDGDTKAQILNELNMREGEIPFKYLGIPLHSRKLTFLECRGLINRMTSRFQVWSAMLLSYGGRVELVRSVLLGI